MSLSMLELFVLDDEGNPQSGGCVLGKEWLQLFCHNSTCSDLFLRRNYLSEINRCKREKLACE